MARLLRSYGISQLGGPTVIGAGIAFYGPQTVTEVARRAANGLSRSSRRRTMAGVRAPVVVLPAVTPAVFIATPIVTVTDVARRSENVLIRGTKRRATYHLREPIVGAAITYSGPRVYLTQPPDCVRRRESHSKLGTPPPSQPVVAVFYGPKVYLTELTWRRRRRRTQVPGLIPAQVIGGAITFAGAWVWLAANERRPANSRLSPPAVVTPIQTQVFTGPKVTLADQLVRITRKRPRSRLLPVPAAFPAIGFDIRVHLARIKHPPVQHVLRPPTDLIDRADLGFIRTHLAYSRRGKARSRLLPVPSAFRPIGFIVSAHLAYSRRGIPKSRLDPPVVIDLRPQTYFIKATLAAIKHPPVQYFLRPPTDVFDDADKGTVATSLAYSRRGAPKSKLIPPTVIDLRPQVYYLDLHLTRIKVPPTIAFLRSPTDLVDRQDVGRVLVHLAYSRRGKPKSFLRPPTDTIGREDQGTGAFQLAYSRRGTPKSRLSPPTVIDLRPQVYYISVSLARIKHPPVQHVLRPPTDLVDQADLGYVRVHLAYSLRGKPKSHLGPPTDTVGTEDQGQIQVTFAPSHRLSRKADYRLGPPTVIDLRPQTYFITTWLAYSLRGKPKSFLRPESKFAPVPQADYTILVHLAYQTRGRPKSILRPPTVIDVRPQTKYLRVYLARIKPRPTIVRLRKPTAVFQFVTAPISITLAPSSRGKPKSRLTPPVVVKVFIGRPTEITLAPQRRGKTKSKLLGVIYAARVYAPVAVTLAPSRLPKPKSKLLGIIYAAKLYAPVTTWLAYSRRGKPKSFLRRPTDLVDRDDLGTIKITLAPSRYPRPMSRLSPPTVVGRFQARPPVVWMAPSSRGVPKSALREPTVIDTSPQVYRAKVTLVRIRPVPTRHFFQRGQVAAICYGTVVGFDFAAEVCGDDYATLVSGIESASTVTGSDSGATVTGASAASGSVSGGDEKTEGC